MKVNHTTGGDAQNVVRWTWMAKEEAERASP
jgi:hypothetical protein